MDRFLDDYDVGRLEGRYVAAEFPAIPFDDCSFDLAVCSHFLFLYSEHLSQQFQWLCHGDCSRRFLIGLHGWQFRRRESRDVKLEWSKWWKTGFLIETVCAEHTLAAGKRSDWHRSRIARAGRRERCRKIHTDEARGGGVLIIANIASRDRSQVQPIWEIPV